MYTSCKIAQADWIKLRICQQVKPEIALDIPLVSADTCTMRIFNVIERHETKHSRKQKGLQRKIHMLGRGYPSARGSKATKEKRRSLEGGRCRLFLPARIKWLRRLLVDPWLKRTPPRRRAPLCLRRCSTEPAPVPGRYEERRLATSP